VHFIDFDAHPVSAHIPFESYGEWLRFAAENPKVFDKKNIDAIASRIARAGITHPLNDAFHPSSELRMGQGDYRGQISREGVISRHRAIMLLINKLCVAARDFDCFRIFSTEAITAFALHLSKLYQNYIGSEFAPSLAAKARIHPAIHQDLLKLDFRDATFDLVITSEVLEHVPSIDTAFSEILRVLKPRGWHIGTHPFLLKSETSIIKAKLNNGQIQHFGEPEYHGNPADTVGGSLVFELPGWDILERAKRAGFSQAQMWFVLDEGAGVLANTCGVYVLCLQRSA
jgi:SAM-dependent methyltransferase